MSNTDLPRQAPSDDEAVARVVANAKYFRGVMRDYFAKSKSWESSFSFALAMAIEMQRAKRVALEARVAELESQTRNFKYAGVWRNEAEFSAGDFVTHGGSLWHANIRTKGVRPGDNNNCWALAVKRGKDAR